MNNSFVRPSLVSIVGNFVRKMFENIDTKRVPRVVKQATTVGNVERISNDRQKIDVVINLRQAPMALAYEFGSGLHAERDVNKTYTIKPRERRALAFFWPGRTSNYPRGRKYIGPAPDGRLMFNYVDHPGIRARPYIRPALESTLEELDEHILRHLTAQIILGEDEVIEVSML